VLPRLIMMRTIFFLILENNLKVSKRPRPIILVSYRKSSSIPMEGLWSSGPNLLVMYYGDASMETQILKWFEIEHCLNFEGMPNKWPPTMIQVDIGGHPPFPTGSKKFSGNFGNLLFLAVFNFRGHFEA
jgi:hypothetical protein